MSSTNFSFDGRFTRRQFWLTHLALLFGYFVAGLIQIFVIQATSGSSPLLAAAPVLIYLVPALWVSLAANIKRLHDRNMTGWWVLMLCLPVVGFLFWFIVLGCLEGTQGANRFGSPAEEVGEGAIQA